MKHEKEFVNESCPLCGCSLIVTTACDPANDTDTEIWFNDGDPVKCEICEFESVISVAEDGEAWVQD